LITHTHTHTHTHTQIIIDFCYRTYYQSFNLGSSLVGTEQHSRSISNPTNVNVTNLFEGAGEKVDERQPEHDTQDPTLAQEPAEHHGGVLLDVHQVQVDVMELNKQH